MGISQGICETAIESWSEGLQIRSRIDFDDNGHKVLRQYVRKPASYQTLTIPRRDTTPAFLDHEFKDSVRSEPASKRAKVSAATVTTISEKLKNNQYHSLEDLASDAARVLSLVSLRCF